MMDEKEVFCDCIRQYESSMYAFAFGLVKNDADAGDILQEAILKAYCNFHSLRDKNKFKSWMMRIIHNTAMDYFNKNKKIVFLDEVEELDDKSYSLDKETEMTVWDAVRRLKLPYRAVVILYYYENYSILQISEITSTSAITVRKQLSRGRKMLAELLKKEDFFNA